MGNMTTQQEHQRGHSVVFQSHFVVDLADTAKALIDDTDIAAKQLAKSSALRAFRATITEGSSHLPHAMMNASGNLRGMVRSKPARLVYNISSNVAEKFEKHAQALMFADIIIEIAKKSHTIHALYKSNLPGGEKLRQADLIVSTAILRAVTSAVPTSAHWIAKSLEGYCQIVGLGSGDRLSTDKWVGALRGTDVQIQTAYQRMWSPEFMQYAGDAAFDMIYAHLHLN